jgi:hypothetical protein
MDELLIPAFILFSLLVPVLAALLLLYAVPVRAAATLVRMDGRREQVVVIAWGPIGIRSSGAGTGLVTEVLVLGHAVLTHTGPVDTGTDGTEPEKAPSPAEVTGLAAGHLPIGELVHIVQRAIGPVGRFGSAFWHQGRFEGASGTVRIGLGDPVMTGELCGYYWASRFVLLASRIDIRLEPEFDEVLFELDLTVRFKIEHPLLVIVAGLDLVRDLAIQDAIRFAMRRPEGVAPA